MRRAFKVRVSVPEDFADRIMDAVAGHTGSMYPGYSRVFSIIRSEGTWIPREGSDPFIGDAGRISRVEELILEFAVYEEDLRNVLRIIEKEHPYEEPGVDVLEMIPWRSLL